MKERSTLLNIQNTIGRTTWLNNVWKELQGIVIGRCDKVEFDTNPNVIASDNNIKYNFKTGEFSQTVIDDYISLSTKNDWAHPGRHTATHWRSRVSWGPTCGPSHIDLLQVDAISGASRPALQQQQRSSEQQQRASAHTERVRSPELAQAFRTSSGRSRECRPPRAGPAG